MNKKGFTLIELLVVIAIIGILSSIAIVYLGDARNKANDAKVISNVTTVSTQVEVDRAGGTTPDITTANAGVSAMITKLGAHPCGRGDYVPTANAGLDKVAVYAELCTTVDASDIVYCADSDGFRGTTTLAIAGLAANAGYCTAQ